MSTIFTVVVLFIATATLSISSNSKTLLVVGDSLSAAYGMPLEQGWVHLLEQRITPLHKVVNASVGGHTTADGLAKLPQLLSTYKPDIVLIALGGNDGLRGYSPASIKKNLLSMINLVRTNKGQVILAGIQIPPSYGNRYTQSFKDVFSQLTEAEKIPLIPFLLEGVPLDPTLMQSDGIHPNGKAQPRLLDNVLPILMPLLSPTEESVAAQAQQPSI